MYSTIIDSNFLDMHTRVPDNVIKALNYVFVCIIFPIHPSSKLLKHPKCSEYTGKTITRNRPIQLVSNVNYIW